MSGTEEILRLTVAALMSRSGERQGNLAAGLGLSQAQVSRKQSGGAHWSLEDVDLLAAHYGLAVLDLLAGPTHAVDVLRGAARSLRPDAPAPAPVPAHPVPASPAPAETVVQEPTGPCVLCGQPALDELDGFPQHLSAEECAEAVAAASPAAEAPAAAQAESPPIAEISAAPVADTETAPASPASPAPAAPSSADPPRRGTPAYASGTLIEQITDRVHDVLAEHEGEADAARAALIKTAIPDVMALLKASRVGGRYEHSEFPPTQDILRKKSQKGADEIWEGRPKWRNAALFSAAKKGERIEVTALDMNAAYLSALKAWLPIGQLREDTSGVHDPKKAGVHLITPAEWHHPDLPNPLGNRMEPGELWVTESTLRLLVDCARQGLADPPTIHRSLVSGATEGLLEKLRRALAETRRTALAEGDELTVAYVKAMYSKFVSTIGESSANREIRRPDWMHIIRSKAFANLWMKAHKAHRAGLGVVEISGTDELHVTGDWRAVFQEGRDLNEVKEKDTYILGGKR
ncbi:acyltransferase [Streptomyces sp. NPDC020472]|uniref:acyltransferase n=1 Tax=Streptomyces sp. NPDC020472 TaxID=3365075 RepID=UPI0037A369BD